MEAEYKATQGDRRKEPVSVPVPIQIYSSWNNGIPRYSAIPNVIRPSVQFKESQ